MCQIAKCLQMGSFQINEYRRGDGNAADFSARAEMMARRLPAPTDFGLTVCCARIRS
jgi:hypothetical protein